MLKMNFEELMKSGYLEKIFKSAKYAENEESYRINLYVTGITACPCKCKFCRNSEISSTCSQFNTEAFKRMYQKYGDLIRNVTFGGGEPLLYFHKVYELLKKRELYAKNRAIITSGIRNKFLEIASEFRDDCLPDGTPYDNSLKMASAFSTIYLSRHHANNKLNQLSFGTKEPLLNRQDILLLPNMLVNRMVVATTCYKNGGVSTVEELHDMIQWTHYVNIPAIIFNDFQKSMTDEEFYKDNQVDDDLFDNTVARLTELANDFHLVNKIVFSGGYTITTYSSEKLRIRVGFKKYHKTREETLKEWENTPKRTYDITMEPDGTVYLDQL